MNKKKICISIVSMFLLISVSTLNVTNIEVDKNETKSFRHTVYECECIQTENIKKTTEAQYFGGELSTIGNLKNTSFPTKENIEKTNYENLPSEWDWRDAELNGIRGDWTTPVKSQGWCGSCWAFALQGVIESVIKIREGDPNLNLDLSEQYMLSCSSGSCKGWYTDKAAKWMKNNGVIPEECFPYMADDSIPCSSKCDNWEQQRIPVKDYNYINGLNLNIDKPLDTIKSLLIQKGPITSQLLVCNDFSNYDEGVYICQGEVPGYDDFTKHIVVIVGYKEVNHPDYDGYFICKNSWGEKWGEDGWFNVAYYNDGKFRSNYFKARRINKLYVEAFVGYNVISLDYEAGSISSLIVDAQNNVKTYEKTNIPISFSGVVAGGVSPYTFLWNFGDDTTSNLQNPTHSYQQNGEYTVTLTVQDSLGTIRNDSDVILIDCPPKILSVEGPTNVKTDIEYTYNITVFDEDDDSIFISFSWGDGPTEVSDFYHSGDVIQVSHTWTIKDNYVIYFQPTDHYLSGDLASLEVNMQKNKATSNLLLQQFVIKIIDQISALEPILKQILQQSSEL